MLTHKPRTKQKLLRIKQKLKLDSPSIWWTSIQHLSSLSVGFRTWLWRYTCLLLSILMLWHRRAIFESKGYKLPSSAEYRIRPLRVWDTKVMKCTDATVEVWEWMSYFTPQFSGHVHLLIDAGIEVNPYWAPKYQAIISFHNNPVHWLSLTYICITTTKSLPNRLETYLINGTQPGQLRVRNQIA